MKLEQKIFCFRFQNKELMNERIAFDSVFLFINNTKTDIPLLSFFQKINSKKEFVIKGYSILQFVNANKQLGISDEDKKIINIVFIDNLENIIELDEIYNPQIQMNDLDVKEEDIKGLIKRIESYNERIEPKPDEPMLYNNENFNMDVEEAKNEGYKLYTTFPKSNYYLLVNSNGKNILIENGEKDYDIINKDEYNIVLNHDSLTFSFDKI